VGAKKLEELVAYRLAGEFKRGVYQIVWDHGRANADVDYRQQLFDAASGTEANINEGWHRYEAGEFVQFLRYARASNAEAKGWLRDGVARGYFTQTACDPVLNLGNRCGAATMALLKSLLPFTRKGRNRRASKDPRTRPWDR
jgi:four helix bundle protein